MTLATHIVIAAAVTKKITLAHPLIGFCVAIASHYFSDAIPHWDYALGATQDPEDIKKRHWSADRTLLWRDLRHVTTDALLGTAVVLLVIRPASTAQWLWAILAIIGGALPDFLQGLYMSGARFLLPLQRFHDRMHAKIRLAAYPLIGIPFQVLIFLLSLAVLA